MPNPFAALNDTESSSDDAVELEDAAAPAQQSVPPGLPVSRHPAPIPEASPQSIAPTTTPTAAAFDLTQYYKIDGWRQLPNGRGAAPGFAEFGEQTFNGAIADLVSKAEVETWKKDNRENGGAVDLIRYHWKLIVETRNSAVKFSKDREYAAYQTPLYSSGATGGEPIYAFFQINKTSKGRQPYYFKEWVIGWTKRSVLGSPPEEADVYSCHTNSVPDIWWHFDETAHIEIECEHILENNRSRMRDICEKYGRKYDGDQGDKDIAKKFHSACEATKRRIKRYARSGEVRPQLFPRGGFDENWNWYTGQRDWLAQLLLPLCMHDPRTADAALALEINIDPDTGERCYLAKTMLTIDMAYWNTRLIAPVATAWLKDNYVSLLEENRSLTAELSANKLLRGSRSSNSPSRISESKD